MAMVTSAGIPTGYGGFAGSRDIRTAVIHAFSKVMFVLASDLASLTSDATPHVKIESQFPHSPKHPL
jgi:hypothetical protein